MNFAVIGTGYVGLVTGAGFADFGHDVTCVDVDSERIATLLRGEVPFYEPGLHDLLKRNSSLGRLKFTTSTKDAVAGAEVVFIAVGTPSSEDGSADMKYVVEAARQIAAAIVRFTVIVTKSTVPVGTADKIREVVRDTTSVEFAIASNPEFLKEGDAVNDFLRPARGIVGVDDPRATDVMRNLYRSVLRTNDRLQVMDVRSAELTKYAANAMLATRISFMNELARLCEVVGADIESIRKGIGADPRIGNKFLFAGAGFGGSCFPKDLRALIHTGREHDVQLQLIEAVERVNIRQKRLLVDRVIGHFGADLRGRRFAIWGLAFKPETDDIRESPALVVIDELEKAGAELVGYDLVASSNIRQQYGARIELASDPYAAARQADALILVTEWHELREPNLEALKATMRTPVLIDGRNVWRGEDARRHGFIYYGIGRDSRHLNV